MIHTVYGDRLEVRLVVRGACKSREKGRKRKGKKKRSGALAVLTLEEEANLHQNSIVGTQTELPPAARLERALVLSFLLLLQLP
jgi:hypothetical protein